MATKMTDYTTFGFGYSVLYPIYRKFLNHIYNDTLYIALDIPKRHIEYIDGIQILHICYGVENTQGRLWVSSANIGDILNKCLFLSEITAENTTQTEFYLDIPSISIHNPKAIAEIREIISSLMGTVWNIGNFIPLLLLEFQDTNMTQNQECPSIFLCSLHNFQYPHVAWREAPFALAIPSINLVA